MDVKPQQQMFSSRLKPALLRARRFIAGRTRAANTSPRYHSPGADPALRAGDSSLGYKASHPPDIPPGLKPRAINYARLKPGFNPIIKIDDLRWRNQEILRMDI
jgi:hypothetical protein